MNLYTRRPQGFPLWPAPADVAGQLSTVGQENVTRLGAWYRDFYAAQGLLPPRGSCPAAGAVFVYTDGFQRTQQTAQAYVAGMFQSETTPDCGVQVSRSDQPLDPYILTAAAKVCAIDTTADLEAFNARINDNPASLTDTYSDVLQTLQEVTDCCQPAACATPEAPTPSSCSLLELPNMVNATGSVGFASGTLFSVADMVTETFELEYAQGMPETDCDTAAGSPCVGWGEIPPGGLYDLTRLHVLNMADMTSQLPSFSQTGSSNLMWQLVGTMDQTLSGTKHADTLAPAERKFRLFVAHDQNLSALAAFLGGVTWTAQSFQPNDPGPGGALVFELHKLAKDGQLVVRLFYVTATLDQMRDGAVLTLETPPERIPLPIPACGGRIDCPYDQFKAFVTTHVRKDCLVTAAMLPNGASAGSR